MCPFICRSFTAVLLLAGLRACPVYAMPQANAGQQAPAGTGSQPSQAAKTIPKASGQLKSQGIKIGEEVTISHLRGSHFGQQAGDVVLDGPDIQMESVNKTRGTHILLMADHAVVHNRANHKTAADLTGNVRYTITEQAPKGTRTIKGTTQRAYYTEANKGLQLLGGVNATLTDPARFDGPATLRVTTLNLPGEGHFELLGDPKNTDARFTPLAAPPKDALKPDATNGSTDPAPKTVSRLGSVHVTGFRNGHLNQGEDAAFDGPLVTIETNNPQTRARNTFKAPRITATLEETQQRIDAKGGIQFDSQTTNKRGVMQRLEGTASTAFWSEADAVLEADGGITAKLTNTVALKEPATLTAGHIKATLSDDPVYVLTGSPNSTRLAFNPRPARGNGAKQGTANRRQRTEENAAAPQAAPNGGVVPAPALINTPAGQGTGDRGQTTEKQGTDKQNQSADLNPQDPDQSDPAPDTQPSTSALPFAFGNIVVSGFQTATYAPGTGVTVAGPKAHFTSMNSATKDFAEMVAPNLSADFDDDNSIVAAKASGGVTYKIEQPIPKSKEMRRLAGDGQDIVLTNTEESRMVQVEAASQLDYYNPVVFPNPMRTDFLNKDVKITYNLKTGKVDTNSPSGQIYSKFYTYAPPAAKPVTPPTTKKKSKRK